MALPTTPNKNLYNGGSEWQNDYSNLPDYQQTFFRNYDAEIGRFIAVDPKPEGSEAMNVYQYADNNPLMNNDPTGAKSSYGAGFGSNQPITGFTGGSTWDGPDIGDWFQMVQLAMGPPSAFSNSSNGAAVSVVTSVDQESNGNNGDSPPDLLTQNAAKRLVAETSDGYWSTLWNDLSNHNVFDDVDSKWNDWLDKPGDFFSDMGNAITNGIGSAYYSVASLLHGETWVNAYNAQVDYWNSSPTVRANTDASVINNMATSTLEFAPLGEIASYNMTNTDGFFLTSVKVTTPVDLNVQLYASDYSVQTNLFRYSTFAPTEIDVIPVGGSEWFGRQMLQITPGFQQPLGQWMNATIPAGTAIRLGLVGSQAGMPFGTWFQMFVPQGVKLQ